LLEIPKAESPSLKTERSKLMCKLSIQATVSLNTYRSINQNINQNIDQNIKESGNEK